MQRWTQAEVDILTKNILQGKTIEECSLLLNRSKNSVNSKLYSLGLRKTGKGRHWTKKEDEMLKEQWYNEDKKTNKEIAKSLNRTLSSVETRAYRLKLGARTEYRSTHFSTQDVVDIFGVSHKTVQRWRSRGLKHKKNKLSKREYIYTEQNLFNFLENNQNSFDGKNINIDIFENPPKWLKEKIATDKNKKKAKMHRKEWTIIDDNELISLLKTKKTNAEIAEKMGRTISSIEARIGFLNMGYKRAKYWNTKDIKYLKDNQHLTLSEMAEAVHRSKEAVRAICNQYGINYKNKRNLS